MGIVFVGILSCRRLPDLPKTLWVTVHKPGEVISRERDQRKVRGPKMALFGKRKDTVPTHRPPQAATPQYASASSLPQPSTDWTDVANVKAEWQGSNLQTREDGLLGWSNGTRLFAEGPIPPQRLNVAEYITRGLAHHLFQPILSDADALLACKRVLTLVDQIPSEPAFMAEFGPRLSRLALTIVREQGWQPSELGGDNSVTAEILQARPDGLVVYSALCPGVAPGDVWPNFFQKS